MKRRFQRVILYAIPTLFFMIIFGLWWSRGQRTTTELEKRILPVRVIYPQRGTMARQLELSGVVESNNQITLLPLLSGRIETFTYQVGDDIKKGEVVAELDAEVYHQALLQAKAAYEGAESSYKRMSALIESGATSEENFTQAKARYENLRSQYELAQIQFGYTKITSPITGTILAKHMNQGSIASPQTPILTLGSITDLIIKTKIPELYLPDFLNLQSDMIQMIRHPSFPESEITGSIMSVTPYISSARVFDVIITLDNNNLLRPGMLLYVSFDLERKNNIIYLPQETLVEGKWLWYVDSQKKAHRLDYEKSFENEDFIQIPSKWEKWQFIEEGQYFLEENQTVRILEEENP